MGLILGGIGVAIFLFINIASFYFYFGMCVAVIVPVLVGLMIGQATTPLLGLIVGGFIAVHFFRKLFR